jgi:oligogalacturonide lyase
MLLTARCEHWCWGGISILANKDLATYPSEYRKFTDEQTGAVIHQLTQTECVSHPPYFLTSAFTPDSRFLIFTSYRTGSPQLYEVEFPDGPIRQLTDVHGLHPYSAVLSPDGNTIYFTRKGNIESLNRQDLSIRLLYHLEGVQFGECDVSQDGNWIVTALKLGQNNGVAIAATNGDGGKVIVDFPRTIIHPQFHPLDGEWIEFAADPAPRMFRVRRDGSELECLYEHDNDEFVVHETFLGETGDLIFTVWNKALKRMDWKSREITTIIETNAWHISPNRAGTKVLYDTNHPDRGLQLLDVATGREQTLCYPRSSNGGTQWRKTRYALAEDFAAARRENADALSWMEMPTDNVYGPQWTHPHPAFNPDETLVSYTSDVSGHAQVYVVELPHQ